MDRFMYPPLDQNSYFTAETHQLTRILLQKLNALRAQKCIIQAQPIGMMRIALNNQANSDEGFFLHVWLPGLPMQ
ncbi:MAG TPA: hypothetical protein VHD33_02620, partial [Legionellaceae bacterium]|nr:hypothetical protein [Legionellaceae bacterium]